MRLRAGPPRQAVSASALSAGALSGGDGGGSAAAASAAALLPSEALQWLHLAASLAAFALADQAFMRLAAATGVSLPAPLLGMFTIIAALAAVEARLGGGAVARVATAVAPGVDWIGRWLPLFYVPSLVTLPLALSALPAALLVKMVALLLVGFVGTLAFAASAVVAIRRVTCVELLPAPPSAPAAGFGAAHRAGWSAALALTFSAVLAAPASLQPCAAQAFMLCSVVWGFLVGSALPAPLRRVLHPLITTAVLANAAALLAGAATGAGWEAVLRAFLTKGKGGAAWGAGDALMAVLHSVILSFGFRVFAQRALMRRHAAEIGGTVVAASAFGMLFSAAAGAALSLPPLLSLALAPRSVTVALALPIASLLGAGADASVTAAAVMFTGLLGANFAQPLLSALGFADPVVRGLATAASAHGLGTAALAAKEPEALPMAALAYAMMGIVSSVLVLVPAFRALLFALAGAAF